MADTIKDFLVSIGWKVNQSEADKFVNVIEKATLRAKLLGDAIEDMAKKAWDAIASVASAFDRLYFSSQRTGAAVSTIRDIGYAVSQLGGSAEAAQASLEAMGQKLRQNPGNLHFMNMLGFGLNKVTGQLEDNLALLKQFQQMPMPQAELVREMVGMDERTFLARRDPKYLQYKQEASEARARFGFDPDQAAKDANSFMTTWRRVSNDLGAIADDLLTKLMKALDGPFQEFQSFIEANGPAISAAIEEVTKAIGAMTAAWVDDFEKIIKDPTSFQNFRDTLKSIADTVKTLADHFHNFIKDLQWLNDGMNANFANPLNRLLGLPEVPDGRDAQGNYPDGSMARKVNPTESDIVKGLNEQKDAAPLVTPPAEGYIKKGWNTVKGWFGYGDQSSSAAPAPAASSGSGADRHLAGGTPGGQAGRTQAMMAVAMDQLRKEGVPEANLRAAAAMLTGNALAESGIIPTTIHDGGTGYGIYGARDGGGSFRRTRMLEWLAKNGYAKDSLEGQTRYMAIEAMHMPAVNGILMGATPGNLRANDYGFIKGFENPKVVGSRAAQVSLAYNLGPGSMSDGGGGYGAAAGGFQSLTPGVDPNSVPGSPTAKFIDGKWVPSWADTHPKGGGARIMTQADAAADAAEGNEQIKKWEAQKANPWGSLDAHAFDKPLGTGGGGDTSIHAPVTNHFHIDGANDPSIVAHMVAANQKSVNADMTRNLIGATN